MWKGIPIPLGGEVGVTDSVLTLNLQAYINVISRKACPREGGERESSKKAIKKFHVYILCNKRNGTLYVGVTSNLLKRVFEHKNNLVDGFTKKYNVHRLVWYETHETSESAIGREKQIKKWNRAWKLSLIEENNPQWTDLYNNICK